MREIKFRGRRSYDKKWIYGSLLVDNSGDFHILESDVVEKDGHHIHIDSDSPMFFDNDTVGQYTGLHDKNGKEIYEGDIVKNHMTDGRINSEEKDYIFEVVWCSSEASFEYRTNADILGNPCCVASNQYRVEVIGNIYENPEVLEMEGENEK